MHMQPMARDAGLGGSNSDHVNVSSDLSCSSCHEFTLAVCRTENPAEQKKEREKEGKGVRVRWGVGVGWEAGGVEK